MRARNPLRNEIIYHDEGVVATRSAGGFLICLPRPISPNHQLGIVAVLWDVWTAARNDVCGADVEWTIIVSELDELTLPLIATMSAIDAELRQAGRELLVVGERQDVTRPLHQDTFREERAGSCQRSADLVVQPEAGKWEVHRPSSGRWKRLT